jgi:preprotein translocase subunit SecA
VSGARLAVPGPVWGERPHRVEAPPGRAPRRGPPAWVPPRLHRAGSGTLEPARIVARAGRLAALVGDDARTAARRARATRAAVSALVAQGLSHGALVQALALAGATMAATVGLAPRGNQYRCAASLLAQRLVELDTGEGKSVAVALAAAVAALAGAPVHVLTANGYLARRDAAGFAPFYRALGLSVSAVDEEADDTVRRRAWGADVAYAAARTLGFDWLRDASCAPGAAPLLRGLCVAIVDEADSILLDEARMPLVIAEPAPDPAERALGWLALDVARRLDPRAELEPTGPGLPPRPNAHGRAHLDALHEARRLGSVRERDAWIDEALAVLHVLRRDVDYLVRGREVVLVDATTGRAAPGRRLSRRLHLLAALKEGVPAPPSMRIAASVTWPRLFARYHHLCGTSGTLVEGARELRRDYGLHVERVAPHRASRLARLPTRLFADRGAQHAAAVRRAATLAAAGRPVLVGTDSVEEASALAAAFARAGVAAGVLDARHDADEAARVTGAGRAGAITVTTQRAGRGTDIALDAAARDAGGLHVLNLQHSRSRRIDRQLEGRCARRGEPGTTEHWLRADAPAFVGHALASSLARHLARRAAPTGDPRGAPAVGRLPAVLWRACQAWWRLEDAWQRGDALRADRERARRLDIAAARPLGDS